MFLLTIIIIETFLIVWYVYYSHKKVEQLTAVANTVVKKNAEVEFKNAQLDRENFQLENKNNKLQEDIKNNKARYNEMKELYDSNLSEQKETSTKAFENFCDVLDFDYQKKSEQYEKDCSSLYEDFQKYKEDIQSKIDLEKGKLEQIKATRTAAQEAYLREKEIKEKSAFYCLQIQDKDKSDIKILENIKDQLSKPRILSMLIWSTYFQKPMTELCNNIVGTTAVTGIYKITNQVTGECYIGQAKNIADRWKTHCKAGLGVDTPAGNKLYKSMMEFGVWNFSWEVLEVCSATELNDKEKYYIELYDSYSYGFNSNRGIG